MAQSGHGWNVASQNSTSKSVTWTTKYSVALIERAPPLQHLGQPPQLLLTLPSQTGELCWNKFIVQGARGEMDSALRSYHSCYSLEASAIQSSFKWVRFINHNLLYAGFVILFYTFTGQGFAGLVKSGQEIFSAYGGVWRRVC